MVSTAWMLVAPMRLSLAKAVVLATAVVDLSLVTLHLSSLIFSVFQWSKTFNEFPGGKSTEDKVRYAAE